MTDAKMMLRQTAKTYDDCSMFDIPAPAAEFVRLRDALDASEAKVEALERAIRKTLDDEETGKWGPDVTVALELQAALAAGKPQQDSSES
jgi:hypothetical protein